MKQQAKGIKDLHELKDFVKNDRQKEYTIASLFKHFCTRQVYARIHPTITIFGSSPLGVPLLVKLRMKTNNSIAVFA